LSGVLVESVTTKPVGVGAGGVSPPATGVWGIGKYKKRSFVHDYNHKLTIICRHAFYLVY